MHIIPFQPTHVKMIRLQDHQAQWQQEINAAQFNEVISNAWTVVDSGGDVMFIGGVYTIWWNRLAAWSLISVYAGKHFKFIINHTIKNFEQFKGHRIECYVDPDFEQGHRFAKLLGFKCEAPLMQKFHQNGTNASMYSKIIDL